MRTAMAAEDQVCLLLARGDRTVEAQEEACRLLATSLRWDLILARAIEHEIYPLLYHNLKKLGFPGVPGHVCSKLEALYKINAFRNVQLTEELVRVLRLLRDARIRTIPLKGVTLATSLYGDPSLRVCADIDILVQQPNVSQAFKVLQANGYHAQFSGRFFEELIHRTGIEYALAREERGVHHLLELHWGILWGAPWDRNSTENLWQDARVKAFLGVPAYAMSPEWEFLFLAAHASRHRWQGLKWLVDIHELCSRGEIDLERVIEKAKFYGWQEIVQLTVAVCHALFDTRIPAAFALPPLPPWLRLFPAVSFSSSFDVCRDTLLPVRLLARPSGKLRYIFRVLFNPTLAELSFLPLPSRLGLLYYPLRLFRLGFKWGWRTMSFGLSWLRG